MSRTAVYRNDRWASDVAPPCAVGWPRFERTMAWGRGAAVALIGCVVRLAGIIMYYVCALYVSYRA